MIRPYDVRVYRRFRAATRAAHGTTLPCWARNASLLRSTYKLHDIWRICNKILRNSEKKWGPETTVAGPFDGGPATCCVLGERMLSL